MDLAINGNKAQYGDPGCICAYAVGGTDYDIGAGHQYAWAPGGSWPGCGGSMLVFGEKNPGDHPDTPHAEMWYEYQASVIGHFPWAVNAIQDDPPVIWDGVLWLVPGTPDADGEVPRTCLGVSADNRWLYWFVTDSGTWGLRRGMYFSQVGAVMQGLDGGRIHHAFCIDGGGSSTLFVRELGGVVNAPSDGNERAVLNHHGAVIPRINVEWVSHQIPVSMVAGQRYDVELEARNPFGPWTWGDDSHPDNLAVFDDPDAETDQFAVAGDWLSADRVRTVGSAVAPGETWTFQFPMRAPATPGPYQVAFHLVRDGVTWYGGEVFRLAITVEPQAVGPDASVPGDSGSTPEVDSGAVTPTDAGSAPDADATAPGDGAGGCDCSSGGQPPGRTSGHGWLLLLVAGALLVRRRRLSAAG